MLTWTLWALALLAGGGVVLAMFKLRYAERFLPHWSELKNIEAILPVRREELRQVTEGVEKCQAEIVRLESTCGDLRILKKWGDEHPEAPARIRQMMVDLERYRSELSALQDKLAAEQERCNKLAVELNEGEQKKRELESQTRILQEQFAELQRRKTNLETSVNQLDERRRRLESDEAGLKNSVTVLESRCKALEKELERLNAEKSAAIRERDQARADRDSAKAELGGLQKSVEAFKAMAESLNMRLKETDVSQTNVIKALEDLAQPALKATFKGAAALDEGAALRRMADHLQKRGLHFPERVQLAFHTSLKAAHINPLVVLAGVSGTGKSALPMAYAEAMGMNFISLAVQPGWSGPQDLLGFYNYLERKYKATELSRALAQMSRFSAKDLPGLQIQSRKDEMLLLLDEMNLARIEYYFSDFLSRLEQRRERNVEDDQRRREVSLLVDAGSLPASEAPRFLFPDVNVLFVGTMNEDESTQSLSDKVIDRANVLRFGAPKKLQGPSTAGTGLVEPARQYLPRATWAEWARPFDGTGFKKEQAMLETLNGELEKINRPFGHRVYRAILDYLANYPGAANDEKRSRHALADQIEQKIIPKLRGLDTQEDANASCLEQLGKNIAELQDDELTSAYTRARQQHLFEWFGVKRS